jgi:hypothetical protein
MARQLGIHTPLFEGCAADLRREIGALPRGEHSPFAALPGTHFARLTVVEGVRGGSVLVCSAVTDVAPAEFIVAVLTRTGDLPERLWSNCPGWPGMDDVPRAAAWLEEHVVEPTLAFCTWDAPLPRVQAGLALRERLIAFAPSVQDLHDDPAALQRAFVEAFGG